MKKIFIFLLALFLFSCTENTETVLDNPVSHVETAIEGQMESAEKISKPTFQTIDEKSLLMVPDVIFDGVFKVKEMNISAREYPLFDPTAEKIIMGGYIVDVWVEEFSTGAEILLSSNTDENFSFGVNSARTEISWEGEFSTDLEQFYTKNPDSYRDLSDMHSVMKLDNIITSKVKAEAKGELYSSLLLTQFDASRKDKNFEKIFIDVEKIRDKVQIEGFWFSVEPRDAGEWQQLIPRVTIFGKNGEKIEIESVWMRWFPESDIIAENRKDAPFFWCYEWICTLETSEKFFKNIDFVEFSFPNGKIFDITKTSEDFFKNF